MTILTRIADAYCVNILSTDRKLEGNLLLARKCASAGSSELLGIGSFRKALVRATGTLDVFTP